MKKFFVFLLIFIMSVCTSTIFAKSDDMFINALRNCTPYNVSGELTVNGIKTYTTKQMQGWQNNKCTYKEVLTYGENTITTVCRFSKPQIQEIVSVSDAYYLTQKYTNEDVDTSSPESLKNNPLANVMGKYLQDPSVCTMEGLK